jgi:hypothetical protein
MYPSISGPYDEPKVGGEVVHLVCPECDCYLDSLPVIAGRRRIPCAASEQLRIDERPAA